VIEHHFTEERSPEVETLARILYELAKRGHRLRHPEAGSQGIDEADDVLVKGEESAGNETAPDLGGG
jgi:hypothetical protein